MHASKLFADGRFECLYELIDDDVGVKILVAFIDEVVGCLHLEFEFFGDVEGEEPALDDFGGIEFVVQTVVVEALELVVVELEASLVEEATQEMSFEDLVAAKTKLLAEALG